MKRLVTKQKQEIRNVANAKFNAHLHPLLGTLEILNVEDTLKCHTTQFVKSLSLKICHFCRKSSKTHNSSTKIKMY